MKSLGMIEFNSIVKGIETCDIMLKAANVTLVRSSTVCPGKYIVLVGGDVGSVTASLTAGKKNAQEYMVDFLHIPNIHEQLIPAICGTAELTRNEAVRSHAIGAVEFYSIASAIVAADEAAKAAAIHLIEVKIGYAIGGKGVVTLWGEVGSVRAAIAAATVKANKTGLFVASTVIPRPADALFESLL